MPSVHDRPAGHIGASEQPVGQGDITLPKGGADSELS